MSYSPTPKFSERFIKSAPVATVDETVVAPATTQVVAEPYSFFGERFFGGKAKSFLEAATSTEDLVTFSNPANLTAEATSKLKDAGILTYPVPDAASPNANPSLHMVVVNILDKEKAKAVLDVMDANWSDTAASAK